METIYKNIIFMKYGVHASEGVEQIIRRKMCEIQKAQKMFWGYGGTICHPLNQVQPFLKNNIAKKEKTYLLMAYTPSEFHNDAVVAQSYSIDRVDWNKIPEGINIYGSKYAIVCKSIQRCDFDIDLADYIVPIGNSKGKLLSEYINGRVDKACGVLCNNTTSKVSKIVNITLCAEIDVPYAVFLK